MLIEASEINPTNELVWLWRSSVAAGYREAVASLERVLELNPNNEKAQQWMAKLKAARAEALARAGLPPEQESAQPAAEPTPQETVPSEKPEPISDPEPVGEAAQSQIAEQSEEEEEDPLLKLLAEKGEEHSGSPFEEDQEDSGHAEDDPSEQPQGEDQTSNNESLDALFGFAQIEAKQAEHREQTEPEVKPIPREEAAVHDQEAEPEPQPVEEATAEVKEEPAEVEESLACPVCEAGWAEPQRICMECRAITDPILVDDAPQHEGADRSALRAAQKRISAALDTTPTFELYRALGLVYLNLRQSNDALEQFREAQRIDGSDENIGLAVEALEKRQLIMAVDDSKTVQRMISSVLEKERYRVAIAGDGLQALARLDEEMPALVLLDITMPRMDGYQACKVISGNEATKHIPVIMLSGKDGFFDKVRGRMVGASNYITKPFEPAALLKAIRKQLPGK